MALTPDKVRAYKPLLQLLAAELRAEFEREQQQVEAGPREMDSTSSPSEYPKLDVIVEAKMPASGAPTPECAA